MIDDILKNYTLILFLWTSYTFPNTRSSFPYPSFDFFIEFLKDDRILAAMLHPVIGLLQHAAAEYTSCSVPTGGIITFSYVENVKQKTAKTYLLLH